MTITTEAQAKKRLKSIKTSIDIFTHAVGVMEVDGWFGHGENVVGLSQCIVKVGYRDRHYTEVHCADGGAVCAGVAIDMAAAWYAKARRWNVYRSTALVERHLGLFQTLNGREPNAGLFRGIASWNDCGVTGYEEMKEAFGVALRKLTQEKGDILVAFPTVGSWCEDLLTA